MATFTRSDISAMTTDELVELHRINWESDPKLADRIEDALDIRAEFGDKEAAHIMAYRYSLMPWTYRYPRM